MKNIIIIIIVFYLSSCLTLSNDNNIKTLFVGKISFTNKFPQIEDFPEFITKDIMLKIRSIENNVTYEVRSDNNGFFESDKLNEGIYELIELSVLDRTIKSLKWRYFVIKRDVINNFGSVVWRFDKYEDNYIDMVQYLGEYEAIEKYFKNISTNIVYSKDWILTRLPISIFRNYQDERFEYNVNGNDTSRYHDIWVFWNILVGQEVIKYPIPKKNESIYEWSDRNIHLVPHSIKNIFILGKVEFSPNDIREIKFSYLMDERNDNENLTTISFFYKDKNNIKNDFGGITIAY